MTFDLDLDSVYEVDTLFRALALTYPESTLRRRMRLLTPYEHRRFFAKLNKAIELVEAAEEILADRASMENEEWP